MARKDCSVSTFAYIDRPLIEAVHLLAAAGWKQLEIMCEGRHGELLAWPEERLAELERTGRDLGICWSIHSPITGCNPAADDWEEAERSERMLLDTLRVAERLDCRCVVLHTGSGAGGWKEYEDGAASVSEHDKQKEEAAKHRIIEFLVGVLERTADSDIVIALENVPPYPGLYGVEVAFLREIVDKLDSPRVGIVFDAGHAHMTGGGRCLLMLQQATPRLVALHLSDNAGQADEHLALGAGTVPLEAMVAWLAACEYRGSWVLEMRSPEAVQPSADRLHSLRRQFAGRLK